MEPLELKVATMDQATTMTAERRRKRREIKEVTRVTKEARIIGHKYFGYKSLEIKSHKIEIGTMFHASIISSDSVR